jgi:uncharacterized protein
MKTALRSVLLASALFGLGTLAQAQTMSAPSQGPSCCVAPVSPTTLSLSANADVKMAPDIATVSAGVVTEAKTAKDALAQNAVRINAVFVAIRAAGIATKDYQTSGISLSPQYVYEPNRKPRITGYQASNRLTIKVRKLEGLGEVLDALVAQGANEINGPTFGLDNPDAALDQARTEAMQTSLRRADLYARAAGLKVKRIVTISESASWSPPQPQMMMMARAMADSAPAPTPVAAGEVSLNAQVSVVFELEK